MKKTQFATTAPQPPRSGHSKMTTINMLYHMENISDMDMLKEELCFDIFAKN